MVCRVMVVLRLTLKSAIDWTSGKRELRNKKAAGKDLARFKMTNLFESLYCLNIRARVQCSEVYRCGITFPTFTGTKNNAHRSLFITKSDQ
ncbi:hypothetical protein TcasGA2_TC004692 [Tribolium castaneum]|uniref:Uncharacterized protein n=1 Tax=Tribolium castaneum TaxID=7070 RepID=D6W691_TRICA|nr:hypothetical protein TcasGA2_TC004692 [Tribolium castaneum]